MAPATVRADYDELKQISQQFSQMQQVLDQMLGGLRSNKETLQGGDWVGQGATAFYKEMDDSVLPTLDRLVKAMESASTTMTTISTIMKNAEDMAANVLKGNLSAGGPTGAPTGVTAGADSTTTGGAPAGAGGSAAGGGGGASSSPSSTGGSNGASAAGSSPNFTPPNVTQSTRATVEQTVTGIGLVASTLSILEAGGAAGAAAAGGTVAAAGVGTTIGAFLLPIGAFFLGTEIAEQRERQEQAMDLFKMKLTGGAMVDATHAAVAQMQANGTPVRELNAQGMAAVKANGEQWKDSIHDDINQQLTQDAFINHGHPEAQWQARYDGWVKGMSQDLAKIYSNPAMTK